MKRMIHRLKQRRDFGTIGYYERCACREKDASIPRRLMSLPPYHITSYHVYLSLG
jgi:hypothetical protein